MKTLKAAGDNKITISNEFADVVIMDNEDIKDVLNSLKNDLINAPTTGSKRKLAIRRGISQKIDLINKFMEISSVGSVKFGINTI
jgi:hypothetical protein